MTVPDPHPTPADRATESLFQAITLLCQSVGDQGFSRSAPGAAAFVSGGQIPSFNSVIVSSGDVDPAVLTDLYEGVAATGLPHCVQVRPGAEGLVEACLSGRGVIRSVEVPLMVRLSAEPPAAVSGELEFRALGPGEMSQHIALCAAGFETPEEIFARVMKEEAFAIPGLWVFVGEVAGEPVTTGVGMLADGWVGVYNIATPPTHRRRGYGAAITAHIVGVGLAAGARAAYLQSTDAGYSVYERLGFQEAERWSIWSRP